MRNALTAFVCLVLLALAAGCANVAAPFGLMPVAQHQASLAAVSAAEGGIADEHLSWAGAIAQQPGAKPLPDLSKATDAERAAWYRARLQRHDELRAVLTTQVSQ
jgi:hypothetical protein